MKQLCIHNNEIRRSNEKGGAPDTLSDMDASPLH